MNTIQFLEPKKSIEKAKKAVNILLNPKDYEENDKLHALIMQTSAMLQITWILLGLFTKDWLLFLLLFMSSIVFYITGKHNNEKYKLQSTMFSGILNTIIIILIIINHFNP